MMRAFLLVGAWSAVGASFSLAVDEPSTVPKPVPASRPELKTALEALKQRQPRLPLPSPADGVASLDKYLPETWGRGGGLGYFPQIYASGAGKGAGPDGKLDSLLTDLSFWVVSRGNNCQYCLGHQELKLRVSGLNDDTIAALDSDWNRFDSRQQATLTFARKLTLEPHLVSDADIAKLKKELSDQKVIEFAFTIAVFNSVNRWTDGLGLPQERDLRDDEGNTLTTPTSKQFLETKSIVTATVRTPRPPLATPAEAQQAIAAGQTRAPRVALPAKDAARRELHDVIGDRDPYEWERALIQVPVNGKTHVKAWNAILSDNNLSPRLKAELTFITSMNNQAWYAAAHAAHRLKQLGASPVDLTSLIGDQEPSQGGAAAAYRLAAKSTTDPHLITDADVANVRKHYSDAETAMIMQVICLANLFDRFTTALGLPLEKEIAAPASSTP
jgi:alkylhydroperoxidase family enzyme